tara:strand:+ start:751 stop:1452 length:702 start_codon:yes stop_codon:yes gene_type:complete
MSNESWFSNILDNFTGGSELDLFKLLGVGGAALGGDFLNPQSPVTGYQGEIPKYEAVRERVAMPPRRAVPQEGADPNRRPGEAGRRYFSDTMYATKPESAPMSVEAARAKAKQQAMGLAGENRQTQIDTRPPKDIKKVNMAQGGILAMREGRYLNGGSDGMADKVPARIDSGQEARLSDGEFVIPADVVSHLGNGNSDAGAKVLHAMMDRVRKERTGNKKQGKEINPKKMLPA